MSRPGLKVTLQEILIEDILESIPIGVMILDSEGRIVRMSSRQEEISQVRKENVIGKFFHEAFPKTLQQGVAKPYWRLLKHHKPFDITIDRYIPQYYDRVMTYRARGAYLKRTNSFVLLHDLEEELYHVKRTIEKRTKELDSSKTFLESLINSSPNIVISTDLKNRIMVFNDTAERAFKYKKSDVIRRSVANLFHKSHGRMDLRRFLNSKSEVICLRADKTTFPASLIASYITDSRGKRVGCLYILADLTEKKEMEERLSLSEKLAVYSELMGGIAHQINNPMIGVVNLSEMLLNQFDDGDYRADIAKSIHKAGKECLQIINSVLGCLKDPRLTFVNLSVNNLLITALEYMRDEEPSSFEGLELSLELADNLPEVMGDQLQLKQCFLNILRNAVEAMTTGPRALSVSTRHREAEKAVMVTISDTGPGIPRENLERVFLPFYSWPRRPGHHGLGLSFAYQIIRNHGGRIQVQSQPGLGTSVVVTLPTGTF